MLQVDPDDRFSSDEVLDHPWVAVSVIVLEYRRINIIHQVDLVILILNRK